MLPVPAHESLWLSSEFSRFYTAFLLENHFTGITHEYGLTAVPEGDIGYGIMGQQLRARLKRKRRERQLKRKKEQAKAVSK